MIYCCEDCGFLFRRAGKILECPRCEREHIRPAAPEEAERLLSLLKQDLPDRKKEEHTT